MNEQRNFRQISLVEHRVLLHFLFHHEQCLYSAYTSRGNTKYVRCINRNCRCRGTIKNNVFSRSNVALHDHENHQHQSAFEIAFEKLRIDVRDSTQAIRRLHSAAIRLISRKAAGMLNWKHCRATLERIRYEKMPPCRSIEVLEAHFEDDDGLVYQTFGMLRDSRFYQGAVGGHLCFANLDLIGELPNAINIFVDGTFGITPYHARQLLVILAELHGKPRPIVYVVMSSQTIEAYQQVFEFIRDGIISFDGTLRTPISVITDFEQAMRAALIEVWPLIHTNGCYFHFTQAIRRRARSTEGLSVFMRDFTDQHKIVLMFMRLGLLPLNRIPIGHAALQNFIIDNDMQDDFATFLEYFHNTWIVRYPMEAWCVGELNRRTNNNLEGYNNKIKLTIPLNPSPWVFLDRLLDLGYDATSDFDSAILNNAPPQPDRSRLTMALRAALLDLEFDTINEFQFLERLIAPDLY